MGANISKSNALVENILNNVIKNNCTVQQGTYDATNVKLSFENCHGVDLDFSTKVSQQLQCDLQSSVTTAAKTIVDQKTKQEGGIGLNVSETEADIINKLNAAIESKCGGSQAAVAIKDISVPCINSSDIKVISPREVNQEALCAATVVSDMITDTGISQVTDQKGWTLGEILGLVFGILGAIIVVVIVVVLVKVLKPKAEGGAAAQMAALTPQGRLASAVLGGVPASSASLPSLPSDLPAIPLPARSSAYGGFRSRSSFRF
jgi:hypothetical protein